MSQGLGMSLDDYIKASKSKGGNNNHSYGNNNGHNNYSGRYKAGGGFNKQQRFKPAGGNYRNRFQRNEEFEENNSGFNKKRHWEHDRFEGGLEENKDFGGFEKTTKRFSRSPQQNSSFNSRNTIRISNLHYAIINKDLHDLFEQFGEITRCEIDWDEIGRSKGTAIIQFNDEESTKKAIDEYNGAELDGQKLVIEYYKKELVPMLRRSGGIQKDRFRQNRGGFPMRKNFNNRRFN